MLDLRVYTNLTERILYSTMLSRYWHLTSYASRAF